MSRYMQSAYTWTDNSGDLWLFSGDGFDSTTRVGQLNDLWKFDTSLNEWTWMGGSSTFTPGCITGSSACSRPVVYGSLGIPATTNMPGARGNAVQWSDPSGNIWLFGGVGTDSAGTWGSLNDLWEFNPSTDEWAWMAGSSTIPNDGSNSDGQFGNYGDLRVPAAPNTPGGRMAAGSWIDTSGNFWIFGGYGCGGNFCQGWLNDLWRYAVVQPAVATPAFDLAGGTYNGSQSLTLSDQTPGATIYFTTDGTTPTATSTVYSAPITVSSSETIKAIATASGYANSSNASAAYTINLPPPTFTFVASPSSLTVMSGSPGSTTLTITPQNGFNAAVSFACSGLPANVFCSFSPNTVMPSGAAVSTQATMTVSAQASKVPPDSHPLLPAAGLAMAASFLFFSRRGRRYGRTFLAVLLFLGVGLTIGACGSGANSSGGGVNSNGGDGGGSSQSYTVTLTATSGTIQQTTTVTLTEY